MNKQIVKRSCGECTKCCEGWLLGNIYGHFMQPGVKCHFLGKGCTIYNQRPEDICKVYNCLWLEDEFNELPEWLKPSLSDVIITKRFFGKEDEQYYWDVTECNETISSTVLNWILRHAQNNKINIRYAVNRVPYYIGSPEFLEFITK